MEKIKSSKTYIVFLDLPIEVSSRIDLVKKKYGPKSFKKWNAHFTLKYEEQIPVSLEKELIKALSKYAGYQKSIELIIGNVEIYKQDKGWNIYLEIENPEIYQIIKNLNELNIFQNKKNKWEQSNKYYPHITLKGGNNLTDPEKVYKLIKKEDLSFSNPVLCKTITLAYWDKDRWKKVQTFKLKGKYS